MKQVGGQVLFSKNGVPNIGPISTAEASEVNSAAQSVQHREDSDANEESIIFFFFVFQKH
jgi:hypothetical protein